jgi:hypothetical protein
MIKDIISDMDRLCESILNDSELDDVRKDKLVEEISLLQNELEE